MGFALIVFAKMCLAMDEMKINDKQNEYKSTIRSSSEECAVCSSNYHQEIITILRRYHSSDSESQKKIETRFCPSCGRVLVKE